MADRETRPISEDERDLVRLLMGMCLVVDKPFISVPLKLLSVTTAMRLHIEMRPEANEVVVWVTTEGEVGQ